MGLSAAARCAGYIPAPTVISPNVNSDAMIAMGETIGCGTMSGSSTLLTTTQIPTPMPSPALR